MSMKRNIVILLAVMMLSLPCVAQRKDSMKGNRAEWKKELQDFKYKYLAQEVELTEEQQEKFFELYVKMESELKTVDSDCKAAQKAVKAEGEHSDAEYEKALNALLNKRVMKGQIEKRYYDQFKTFLSVKQLYKLKTAEQKFNKKLMELRKKEHKAK